MKYVFSILLFVFQVALGADVRTDAFYAPGLSSTKNYIKNPDCEKNTLNITSSTGLGLSQNTSTPLNTQTNTQCRWNPGAAATLKWDMYPMSVHHAAQQCVMSFYTDTTTSGVYQAWLEYDGVKQTNTVTPINANTKGQKFTFTYPCSLPSGTTVRKFVIESLSSSLPILIASVHFEESQFQTGVYLVQPPTVQKFTTGTSQTYTTPAGALYIRVRMVGGGGGGGGSGTSGNTDGGNGGATTFGTLSAGGGIGAAKSTASSMPNGGSGGSATGSPNIAGVDGQTGHYGYLQGGSLVDSVAGGDGGASLFGGAGRGRRSTSGETAAAYSGSGGGGGGVGATASTFPASGGGSGAYVEHVFTNPAASYLYTVGSGGTLGAAGTGGFAGGAGASGMIIVEEYYQ